MADYKRNAYVIAQYLDAIPDDQWETDRAGNPEQTKFCAWGHLAKHGPPGSADMLEELLGMFPFAIAPINNGHTGTDLDLLPTPRQRVVAALREIEDGKRIPAAVALSGPPPGGSKDD